MRVLGLVVVAMVIGGCSNADAGDSVTGDQSAISGGKVTTAQSGVGAVRFYDYTLARLEERGVSTGIVCTGTLVSTRAVLTASACVTPLLRVLGDLNRDPEGFTNVAGFLYENGTDSDEANVQRIYTHGAFALLALSAPVTKAKPVELWSDDDDAPMWVHFLGYGCSSPTADEPSRKHQLDADWDDSANRPKGGSVWCDKLDLGAAVLDRPYAVGTGPLYAIMTGPNSFATISSDRTWIRASIDGLRR